MNKRLYHETKSRDKAMKQGRVTRPRDKINRQDQNTIQYQKTRSRTMRSDKIKRQDHKILYRETRPRDKFRR